MIHVENLTKYYKELCAVDRINFDVQKGEILGLMIIQKYIDSLNIPNDLIVKTVEVYVDGILFGKLKNILFSNIERFYDKLEG